ncbi:hypothetical protein BDZ91DRAFT_724863 [Kalaharituber pfeilii]|nr:hypothetical protein BDZ91DRAFT_724863 [Kalaharituber pfeilii]
MSWLPPLSDYGNLEHPLPCFRRERPPPPRPAVSSTSVRKCFPTPHQVWLVHDILTVCLQLPVEIALLILDFADYTPALTARMAKQTKVSASYAKTNDSNAATALLVTDPIPKGAKVKSITWWTKSNDQGWSGERAPGEYAASWTWFEACILRHSNAATSSGSLDASGAGEEGDGEGATVPPKLRLAEQLQTGSVDLTDPMNHFPEEGWEEIKVRIGDIDVSRWVVQRNARAKREPKEHVVEWRKVRGRQMGVPAEGLEWGEDGKGFGKGFFEALREGDMVVLIGRARYPEWVNRVWGAEVEVRFSA